MHSHAERGERSEDQWRDAERIGRPSHSERGNDQINSFPAKASPTKSMRGVSGTGGDPRRTGFSREAFDLLLIFIHKQSRHHKSRLGCRRSETGVKEPDEVGPNQSRHFCLLLVGPASSFSKVSRRRRNPRPLGRRP